MEHSTRYPYTFTRGFKLIRSSHFEHIDSTIGCTGSGIFATCVFYSCPTRNATPGFLLVTNFGVPQLSTAYDSNAMHHFFIFHSLSDGGPFVPWLIVVLLSVQTVKNGHLTCLVSDTEELFAAPESSLLAISHFK